MSIELERLQDISRKFDRVCHSHHCKNCPIAGLRRHLPDTSWSLCTVIYTHGVLTGTLQPDGTPVVVTTPATEKPEKPTTPEWFKAGSWVRFCERITKILEVRKDGIAIVEDRFDGTHKETGIPVLASQVVPVYFRKPTFDEASKLTGKALRVGQCDILVTVVYCYRDTVYLNDSPVESWMDVGATIDGVPLGVPEVGVAKTTP